MLRVDLPDLSEARELLKRRLAGLPHRGTVGAGIVELCGRLPLALAILAARIAARQRLARRWSKPRSSTALPNCRTACGSPRSSVCG
jgi:hypothetical protein